MFDRWIHTIQFLQHKKITAVSLFKFPDDTLYIEWAEAYKKKNEVILDKSGSLSGDFDQLFQAIDSQLPMVLTFDGKGVLTRQWEGEVQQPDHVFSSLVPQGKLSDFFVQVVPSLQTHWVCLCRKNSLDEILTKLQKHGVSVIDLVLGPFILQRTKSFINTSDHNWHLKQYAIIWSENNISSFGKEPVANTMSYNFGGDLLLSDQVIPFSHAFDRLAQLEQPINDFSEIVLNHNNSLYKKAFRLVGVGFLAIYFGLLVMNYLFFNKYSEKLNQQNTMYQSSIATLNELEQLTADLVQKERIARKAGVSGKRQRSYIADCIASELPDDIVLTEMSFNPLDSKRQKKDVPEFIDQTITIKGTMGKSSLLYRWISTLKQNQWVKEIEVIDLYQEDLANDAYFELKVKLVDLNN